MNTFKAAFKASAANEPLIDHTEEHLNCIFHEVFSSSLLNVSNSCCIDVGTTISLMFELVEADRGYEPAWKLLFALTCMPLSLCSAISSAPMHNSCVTAARPSSMVTYNSFGMSSV